jgi:hypothetical protein
MYLIHAYLRIGEGTALTANAATLITGFAYPEDHLEHVVVHPYAHQGPVLGLFLRAANVEAAKVAAAALCRRAFAAPGAFGGEIALLRCATALPTAEQDPAQDPMPRPSPPR